MGRTKVALLTLLDVSNDTGGRTYLSEIVPHLAAHDGIELTVHLGDPHFELPDACRIVRHRTPSRGGAYGRIAAEAAVARRIARAGSDILLAPFNYLPYGWSGPSVVVEQSLLSFGDRLGGEFSPVTALYRSRALTRSVRRASEVVAVSEYLRGLLLQRFPSLEPAKVHVVPLGAPADVATRAGRN